MSRRGSALGLTIAALLILPLVPGTSIAATSRPLSPYDYAQSVEIGRTGLNKPATALATQARAATYAEATRALATTPLMFVENVGQFAEEARFRAYGGERTIWLTEDALWVTVLALRDEEARDLNAGEHFLSQSRHRPHSSAQPRIGVNLKLSFTGANPDARLEPFRRLDTHMSYFIGSDPEHWHPDVPVWGGVRYVDLYPGINLEITGVGGNWTWRLVFTSPQCETSISQVRLRVEGAEALSLDGNNLRATTAVGDFGLPLLKAIAWNGMPRCLADAQPDVDGIEVRAPFYSAPLLVSSRASIRDKASDLIYSTFLGGSDSDYGRSVAVDGEGSAYVAGETYSSQFPTTAGVAEQSYNGSGDGFIVKLNPSGTQLAYATFLGGGEWEVVGDIAVDASGNAYVTGHTASSDFPATSSAYDAAFNGAYDVFVLKLAADGGSLLYSTFIGGSGADYGHSLDSDSLGNAIVTGLASGGFPTTPTAYDTTFNGECDAFVLKLSPDGTLLLYSTYVGGAYGERGMALALDGSGNAVVTGETYSNDFPTTAGAYDESHNGGQDDVFVLKIPSDGSSLMFSTFVGGSDQDWSSSLALDNSGNIAVAGETYSHDFPTTAGAYDRDHNGSDDAFVIKLSPDGESLLHSTFLGGGDYDRAWALDLDSLGNILVTGETYSADFPATEGAYDSTHNGGQDAFVVKLEQDAGNLACASFLGGSHADWGWGIAVNSEGIAYITGGTGSSDFPTTDAYDTSHNGYWDAFVSALDMMGTPAVTAESSVGPGHEFFLPEAGEEAIPARVFVRGGEHPEFLTQTSTPEFIEGVEVEVVSPTGQVVKTVDLLQSGARWQGSWDWTSNTWNTIPDSIPVGEYTARFRTSVDGCTTMMHDRAFYVIFNPEEVTAPDRFEFNERGIWFVPDWGTDRAYIYELHPDDYRVFRRAIQGVEGETDQETAARKLLNYEHSMFYYEVDQAYGCIGCACDVLYLLVQHTAQCADDANMLTALLRSVGIPAHPVTADFALEHNRELEMSFDTWVEARLDGSLGQQWYALHPHQTKPPGLGPEPRKEAGTSWWVASKTTDDVIIMANENWDEQEILPNEADYAQEAEDFDDLRFGYNECDQPNRDFDYKAAWIDHLCWDYWRIGHWACTSGSTRLSNETSTVDVSLDKERYSINDEVLITVTISNPTSVPVSSTLTVSITADYPLSKQYPDQILWTFGNGITVGPDESEMVTKSYDLPFSLSSDNRYYVEAEYSSSWAIASLDLDPLFKWSITLPERVEVGEEFLAKLTITNPLDIALESITGTLALPFDVDTQDPQEQRIPALGPRMSEELTWVLKALSHSEVSQLVFAVLSEDAGSLSVFTGVEIYVPTKTYLPLVLRSH